MTPRWSTTRAKLAAAPASSQPPRGGIAHDVSGRGRDGWPRPSPCRSGASSVAAAIGTGPATADALWISSAMTTPPSAAGWTIQFMPRRITSAGGCPSGSCALAVARSIALRIVATSSSVQADGLGRVDDGLGEHVVVATQHDFDGQAHRRLLPEKGGKRGGRRDRLLAGELRDRHRRWRRRRARLSGASHGSAAASDPGPLAPAGSTGSTSEAGRYVSATTRWSARVSSRSGGPTTTIWVRPRCQAARFMAMNGTARAPASSARPEPAERAGDPLRRGLVRFEVHQLDQVADRDGAGRRLGAVVLLLEAEQHGRVAARGVEPAGAGLVPEQPILRRLHLAGPGQPRRIAGRLQQLEAAPDDAGVVLAIAVDAGVAGAPAATAASASPAARAPSGRSARRARRGRSTARREPDRRRRGSRPARAIAAIIRPFHDVSTLSSSDGRGRRLRASSSTGRARATTSTTSSTGRPTRAAMSSNVAAV